MDLCLIYAIYVLNPKIMVKKFSSKKLKNESKNAILETIIF